MEEALQEWNHRDVGCYAWEVYLLEAISIILGAVDRNLRVSSEAVGVAKALKLAIRLREFYEKTRSEGRSEYTLKEKFDFIRDILEA